MEEALQPTAGASSQPVGWRGQRWPGRSTRGNEGLSSQLWVRWETRPFKQDNCPCSWPPDIRSAFFQCHSLMAFHSRTCNLLQIFPITSSTESLLWAGVNTRMVSKPQDTPSHPSHLHGEDGTDKGMLLNKGTV